jgi:CRISPR/Cas system Type II protein with McrA/HNH and RuvC-like nuclease domain
MYTCGFDLGTTSIGLAVLEYDPRGAGRIHQLGARIFPEGVTEDKKEPRNKARRAKRLMRRGIRSAANRGMAANRSVPPTDGPDGRSVGGALRAIAPNVDCARTSPPRVRRFLRALSDP